MSTAQSNAVKVIALSAASIALLSACGEPKATPMDDEYAGNSGESVQSQEEKSKTDGKASGDTADDGDATKNRADANSATSDKQDTGNYADGDYSINGQYGPVGEDTIDVHLTVKDQNVTAVKIVGHPFTSISKKHQNDFAKAVPDAVVGKPLKDLKVDKLAGASWTSEAFNKALEVARQEATRHARLASVRTVFLWLPCGFGAYVRPEQRGHVLGPGIRLAFLAGLPFPSGFLSRQRFASQHGTQHRAEQERVVQTVLKHSVGDATFHEPHEPFFGRR